MDDSFFQGFEDHLNSPSPVQSQTDSPKPFQIEQPRSLLSRPYSLEPDMLKGWIPKIPSIPMPLYYGSSIQAIKDIVRNSDTYKIAYEWKNTKYNTVKLHQENNYAWDKRNHFEIKWKFLQDAVQSIGKPKKLDPLSEICKISQENQFKFNADFESGNLQMVIKVSPNEYDCYLRSDSNTTGHTNWYWFTVQNLDKIGPIKINLCNLRKTKNLYGKGMAPFVKIEQNQQWTQQPCEQVTFVQKLCRYQENVKTHTMQFKYTFTQPNQILQVAYCIPYTYSQLQNFIKEISPNKNFQISSLGDSFTGLTIPLLKIINHKKSSTHKQTVLMIGRTHPGESNSSWVVEGIIKELLSDSNLAKNLRERYEFWIIPMLNVDGVVLGNFRCGGQGTDFNRCFSDENSGKAIEVSKVIELVKNLKSRGNKLEFVIDFHGHSQKENCFFYGPQFHSTNPYYIKSRLFAKLFQEKCISFKYKFSNFHIPDYKKTTARSYMNTILKIPMTFTLQVSNGVYDIAKQRKQYDRKDFESIGKDLLKSMHEYSKVEDSIGEKLKLIETKKSTNSMGNLRNRSSLRNSLTKDKSPFQNLLLNHHQSVKKKLNKRTSLNVETEYLPESNETPKDSCDRFFDKRIQTMIEEVNREKYQNQMGGESQESDFESGSDDFEETQKLQIAKQVESWTNQLTFKSHKSIPTEKKQKIPINLSSKTEGNFLQRQIRQSHEQKIRTKENERSSATAYEKSQPRSIRSSHTNLTKLLKKSSKPYATLAAKQPRNRTVIQQQKNLYELRATEMNSREYSRVELNPKDQRNTEAVEKENFGDFGQKPKHSKQSALKFVESLAITSQSTTFHEKQFSIKMSTHEKSKQPIKLPKSSLWKSKSIKNLLRSNRFPFMLQKFA